MFWPILRECSTDPDECVRGCSHCRVSRHALPLARAVRGMVHADWNQDSQERFVHRTQVVEVVLVPNPQGLVAWYEMFGAFWDIIVIVG